MCQSMYTIPSWLPCAQLGLPMFRTELEAQWAKFFEMWGISYRYNPEGFVTNEWNDIPDFFLPGPGVWLEIRPETDRGCSDSIQEFYSPFVVQSRQPLLVLFGRPELRIPEHQGWAMRCVEKNQIGTFPVHLVECPTCGGFCAVSFRPRQGHCHNHNTFQGLLQLATTPTLLQAYQSAQQETLRLH